MSSEIAIKVESLSKCYQIYGTPRDRLKQFILPRACRVLGRSSGKYYRDFWALKDVSFEVKKGETVGIIGRNGSGKSTLLQMICGTLAPSFCNISTNGRIAALLELGAGFNPEFTGRENVYLNGAVLGLSIDEIDEKYESIVDFAEIGDFIDQPIKTYSSGMMVRLAFSVQAAVDPEVLIVDEALAVGDERFQRKCFSRLENLKNRGTAILFVSHSGPQVIELCDRAILLDHGECLLQADPALAVRTYQRIIYAAEQEQKELIDQIRAGKLVERKSLSSEREVEASASVSTLENDFDPALKPTSTIRYPENGARIEGIEIRDLSGRRVNILVAGQEYFIVMHGEFLTLLECVYFGVHIRTISGTEISGQRHPHVGSFIELATPGKRFEVSFHFRLALIPDTYFFGGGVWAREPMCVGARLKVPSDAR